MTVGVTAAIVDAVGLVFFAPGHIYRQQLLLVIELRNHRVGTLRMEVERLIQQAGDAVDRNGGCPRLTADVAEESLHHAADLGKVGLRSLGVEHHIHQNPLALHIEGQVQHTTPVDIARHVAIFGLKLLDKAHKSLEGGRAEGGLFVDGKLFAVGAYDLRSGIGTVFDGASQHLGQQVTRSQMHSSDFGTLLGMVLPQAAIPKTLVERLFHELLIAHATTRVIEEIFVKDNSDVLVPPRGVKNDINGQRGRAEFFHGFRSFSGRRAIQIGANLLKKWQSTASFPRKGVSASNFQ